MRLVFPDKVLALWDRVVTLKNDFKNQLIVFFGGKPDKGGSGRRVPRKAKFQKNTEDWKYLPKYYPFKFGWQKTMPFNPKWQEREHAQCGKTSKYGIIFGNNFFQ